MLLVMTASSGPTLYDEIRYPARSFEYTHPNRLATIAALYAMRPAPITNCRVLELGCGVGGNIIPMAYQNPGSAFVGIDLSAEAIAVGQARIAALALKNISLHHLDILDVGSQFGRFDYIIAHGVYSWVPEPVRQKIFTIARQLLNPHGVSYISYNAHPYSRMRDMVRDMMLFHTRHLTDPKEKIGQARAITKFITESTPEDTAYGKVMRYQRERIDKIYNEVLFHDDLNDSAEAFLLYRFVEEANRHGLQYLGDVDFVRQDMTNYSDEARSTLQSFPPEMLMVRDQYQDFIDGAGFRRTLLCHDDVKLTRQVTDNFVKRFFLSAPLKAKADSSKADIGSERSKTDDNAEIETSSPLQKAIFRSLGKAWPHSLTFDELATRVFDPREAEAKVEQSPSAMADFCALLAATVRRGDIIFRFHRPDIVTTLSERPEVSPVARLQAGAGEMVTNLRHSAVAVDNAMSQQFLTKVDGTRTLGELQAEVNRLNSTMPEGAPEAPSVEGLLLKLANSALLVR